MKLTCLALAALLVSAICSLAAEPKEPSDFPLTKDEETILKLTNQAREKENLPPLRVNALLSRAARAHSANMAKKEEMKHELDGKNPAQRLDAAGYEYTWMGENIAWSEGSSIEEVFKGWMESEHHRENILKDKFQEIGIGIAHDDKGKMYYTQVFGSRGRGR